MIIAILIFAAVLRFLSLNQSLWLDEAINVLAVKSNSLLSLITYYPNFDFHPPGFFIILSLWTQVFGYSELSVRMPSLIFGVISIYLIYLIGKNIHSKNLGLVSALLLAVNPLHIYYSQEARMYSLAAMAVSLNLLFFIKLFKNARYAKIGFFISLLLVFISDYLAYFIVPAQLVGLLINREKKVLINWIKPTLLAAIAWSWWVPFFINQLKSGLAGAKAVPGWKEVVGAFGIKPLALTYIKFIIGRISFSSPLTYLAFFTPIGILFAVLIFKSLKDSDSKTRNYFLSFIFIPILISSIISIKIPIYSYFRVLFVLIPFIIFAGIGLISFKKNLAKILLLTIILFEVFFSLLYLTNPSYQREDWQSLVKFLSTKQPTPVILETNNSFAPFDYYATNKLTTDSQIAKIAGLKQFPATNTNDLASLQSVLEDKHQVYLLQYLVDIADPQKQIRIKLSRLGFKQTNIYNFNGVGFLYLYEK